MGWKSIKDHYSIGHFVAIHTGKGICIGSSYVHDLIRIDPEKRRIEWGKLGPSSNDDLSRYWAEIHADLGEFWALVDREDTFSKSLPVFTYDGGEVVECQCEEYGWPNVTHCGQMMYENTFFETEEAARQAGIRNAKAGIEALIEQVQRRESELAQGLDRLAMYRANLAKLSRADQPEPNCLKAKTVTITEDQIVVERQALLDIVAGLDTGLRTDRFPKAMDILREPFFADEIATGEARRDFALNKYQ